MMSQCLENPAALENLRERLGAERDPRRAMVVLCAGTGCLACGCMPVARAFEEVLASEQLAESVELKLTGCHGPCERGPLVLIQPEGIFYQKVTPADVKSIVSRTLKGGQLVDKLLYRDPSSGEAIVHGDDIPF